MNEDDIADEIERQVAKRIDARMDNLTKQFERQLAEVRAVKPAKTLDAARVGEELASASIALINARTRGFEDRLAALEKKRGKK